MRLANALLRLPVSAESLCKEGRLCEIPGVGPALAAAITEYLLYGTCRRRQEWERRAPRTLLQLLSIPGIGLKTVRRLYTQWGIESLEGLERAVNQGTLNRIDTRTATNLRNYFLRKTRNQMALSLFADGER
jgi:DNA polymerase (family 10)